MKYFSIRELSSSATAVRKGIDNTPDARVKANLTALVANVLDPVRERYGKPIVVTSGYRSEKLNRAIIVVRNRRWVVREIEETLTSNGRKPSWKVTCHPIEISDESAESRWVLTKGVWDDGGAWLDDGRWND